MASSPAMKRSGVRRYHRRLRVAGAEWSIVMLAKCRRRYTSQYTACTAAKAIEFQFPSSRRFGIMGVGCSTFPRFVRGGIGCSSRWLTKSTGTTVSIIFDSSKPLMRLRAIAESLGWRGLQLWRHAFDNGDCVHWYQTSDTKFMLWITEYPLGQNDYFATTVHADRYGICSGEHAFSPSDPDSISNLVPLTSRRLFRDRKWRKRLQCQHPDFCIEDPTPSRCLAKRLSGDWPPVRLCQQDSLP